MDKNPAPPVEFSVTALNAEVVLYLHHLMPDQRRYVCAAFQDIVPNHAGRHIEVRRRAMDAAHGDGISNVTLYGATPDEARRCIQKWTEKGILPSDSTDLSVSKVDQAMARQAAEQQQAEKLKTDAIAASRQRREQDRIARERLAQAQREVSMMSSAELAKKWADITGRKAQASLEAAPALKAAAAGMPPTHKPKAHSNKEIFARARERRKKVPPTAQVQEPTLSREEFEAALAVQRKKRLEEQKEKDRKIAELKLTRGRF